MDAKFIRFLSLIFSVFVFSTAFTPQDDYLISCGSTKARILVDNNRYFLGDSSPNYLPQGNSFPLQNPNPSSNSSASARVFTSASTYTFQIKNLGTHFVRLHFYPFTYANYDLKNGKFSVVANGFSLLSNFSAANFTGVKEFLLMVDKTELRILFKPASDSNFAFVNAVEVFLAPSNLFNVNNTMQLISPNGIQEFKGNISSHVLECVHRVNVGGSSLNPSDDTLWRRWVGDEDFLVLKSAARIAKTIDPPNYRSGGATREHAPDTVYMTAQQMNVVNGSWTLFNITWDFPVRLGEPTHFVRLHFSDIVSASLNTLYFNVYINGLSAYRDMDLSALASDRLASPCYIDFVVKNMRDSGFVRISVGPSELTTLRRNAILNGVEIMRVLNFVDSKQRSEKRRNIWILVALVLVGGFSALSLFLAMLAVVKFRKTKRKPKISGWTSLLSSRASLGPYGYYDLKIPLADIQQATNNFDNNLIIRSGNFFTVYKGILKDNIKVAVKRGLPGSPQCLAEFETEITVLSRIRHCHIVPLVGFCEEQSEMILVYEYMENGPLRNHLYSSDHLPPLSWEQRLEICIGAARGLHYLHTGVGHMIIHRDIKSSNILLDENLVAKVAGFGVSRPGPCPDETHVSTGVKGSFGYQDPEYVVLEKVTEKSDVYSFGVVLLEVVCGRGGVVDGVKVSEWAMELRKKGMMERMMDERMMSSSGEVKASSLEMFAETAEKCLGERGVDRPTMGDVLWNLERALHLQIINQPQPPPNIS